MGKNQEKHNQIVKRYVNSDLTARKVRHDRGPWLVIDNRKIGFCGNQYMAFEIHVEQECLCGGGIAIVPEKAGSVNCFAIAAAPVMFDALVAALGDYSADGEVSDATWLQIERAVLAAAPDLRDTDGVVIYAEKERGK